MNLASLSTITLTGVDPSCDMARIGVLSEEHRLVEWGVLYSPKRAGLEGRYPTLAQAQDLLDGLRQVGGRSAVHLCGGAVDQLLEDHPDTRALVALAGRVQINFNQARRPLDLPLLDAVINALHKPVITQHHAGNADVYQDLASRYHQVLFDASGGTGVAPETWPAPLEGKLCGYAGGLGPGVVAGALDGIARAAGERVFWIDMETRLRDDADRFDLDRCERVLEEVRAWQRG